MEIRTAFAPLEIKAVKDDGTFEGYASVFDNEDSYGDIVRRGAFEETLKAKTPDQIAMLWQHNFDEVIGSWKSFKEDDRGLYAEGKLITQTQRGAEAHALLKEGAIKGLSIGFVAKRSDFDEENEIRNMLEIDLWEVSIVTFPANREANVMAVRNAIASGQQVTKRDMERALSEMGLSRREAMRFMSDGFEGLVSARDAGTGNDRDVRDAEADRELVAAIKSLTKTMK